MAAKNPPPIKDMKRAATAPPVSKKVSSSLHKVCDCLKILSASLPPSKPFNRDALLHLRRMCLEGVKEEDLIQICERSNLFQVMAAVLQATTVLTDVIVVLEIIDYSFSLSKVCLDAALAVGEHKLVVSLASVVSTVKLRSNPTSSSSSSSSSLGLVALQYACKLLKELVTHCEGALDALLASPRMTPFVNLIVRALESDLDAVDRDAAVLSAVCVLSSVLASALARNIDDVQDRVMLEVLVKLLLAQFTADSPGFLRMATTRQALRLLSLCIQNHDGFQEACAVLVPPLVARAKFMPDSCMSTETEKLLYLDVVSLLACIRHENPSMSQEVESAWRSCQATLPFHHSQVNWGFLLRCFQAFDDITQDTDDIQCNPWDEHEIAEALWRLTETFHMPQARHIGSVIPLFLRTLVQCTSNIDENIMGRALACTYRFLVQNPSGHDVFLEQAGTGQAGLWALSGSLWDYNVHIKLSALEILVLLASSPTLGAGILRDDLRRCGVLEHVVRMCKAFGTAEDITLEVVSAAAGLLSHSLTVPSRDHLQGLRANQEYVHSLKGIEALLSALQHCVGLLEGLGKQGREPGAGLLAATDQLCLVVGNALYHSPRGQEDFCQARGFETLERVLQCSSLLGKGAPDIVTDAGTVLANALDTNPQNQRAFAAMDKWKPHIARLLNASGLVSHASVACLLLSHATWNNPANQTIFGSAETLRRLLEHLSLQMENLGKEGKEGKGNDEVQDRQQLALLCLLALNNLTNNNKDLLDLLGALDGIRIISKSMLLFADRAEEGFAYELRKTTAFCLGNLVKNHPSNARLLGEAGGVGFLLDSINNDEDDELSKKSFQTLLCCGDTCVVSLVAFITEACTYIGRSSPHSAHAPQPEDLEAKLERLAVYLPVLNGLVYTSASLCAYMVRTYGLHPLLGVLQSFITVVTQQPSLRDKAVDIGTFAAAILVNLTMGCDPKLQTAAGKVGALELFDNVARASRGERPPSSVTKRPMSAGPRPPRAPPSSTILPASRAVTEDQEMWASLHVATHNLVLGHPVNLAHLLHAEALLAHIVQDCACGLISPDMGCASEGGHELLLASLDLLLYVCEASPAPALPQLLKMKSCVRPLTVTAGSDITVQQLLNVVARKSSNSVLSSLISDAISTKAQQLLSRLRRLSSSAT